MRRAFDQRVFFEAFIFTSIFNNSRLVWALDSILTKSDVPGYFVFLYTYLRLIPFSVCINESYYGNRDVTYLGSKVSQLIIFFLCRRIHYHILLQGF